MAQPVLWGSPIALPAGILMPQVTALRNGTFLVIGKTGNYLPKAWIFNADGSLKHEQLIEIPDAGVRVPEMNLDLAAIDLIASELPDGRIALTWTSHMPSSGYVNVWSGLYGADLTPLGNAVPVTTLDPGEGDTHFYHFDAVASLGNGSLAISYRHESDGKAFLRILNPNGELSIAVELGSASTNPGLTVTALTPLPNGSVVAAVREKDQTIKGYLVTPSGSGSPVLSDLFLIGSQGALDEVTVTALKGGGFAVAYMDGMSNSSTAFVRIYTDGGSPVTDHIPVTTATGTITSESPKLLALPSGGFAVAYEKAIQIYGGVPGREVYLALFDAQGSRVSDDVRVSNGTDLQSSDVASLPLMGDGRIVVHHSEGLRIVDPRSAAVSLKGTAGSDQYIGTAFNDTFSGSAGADRLNGGAGTDYVSFTSAKAGVTASLTGGSRGDAAGDAYARIEGLLGSAYADVFTGNGAAILKGRSGNDTYAVKGRDKVYESAGEGRDTVIARGSFTLRADAHVEVLKLSGLSSTRSASLAGSNTANEILGHGGANTLKGHGGNDVVRASSGKDKIHGGSGNDRLYGGSGKDIFVFDTRANKNSNVDRIYDFKSKDDGFHLDNKYFTKLGSGYSKGKKFMSDMFVENSRAKDREDRIVYDRKKGNLYYDADGTGSKDQVKIATITNKAKLYFHDFFVI